MRSEKSPKQDRTVKWWIVSVPCSHITIKPCLMQNREKQQTFQGERQRDRPWAFLLVPVLLVPWTDSRRWKPALDIKEMDSFSIFPGGQVGEGKEWKRKLGRDNWGWFLPVKSWHKPTNALQPSNICYPVFNEAITYHMCGIMAQFFTWSVLQKAIGIQHRYSTYS